VIDIPPKAGHMLMPYRWERAPELRFTNEPNPYAGWVEHGEILVDPTNPHEALEELYAAFNRGSGRETQFAGPSMSVGDIVTLGETSWVCAPCGWEVHR